MILLQYCEQDISRKIEECSSEYSHPSQCPNIRCTYLKDKPRHNDAILDDYVCNEEDLNKLMIQIPSLSLTLVKQDVS